MDQKRRNLIKCGALMAATPIVSLVAGCERKAEDQLGASREKSRKFSLPADAPPIPEPEPAWTLIYGWGTPWDFGSAGSIIFYGDDPNRWPPSTYNKQGPRLYAGRTSTVIKFRLVFWCWMERQADTSLFIELHSVINGVRKDYRIPFHLYIGSCVSRWFRLDGTQTIPAAAWGRFTVDDYDYPEFWMRNGCKPGGQ